MKIILLALRLGVYALVIVVLLNASFLLVGDIVTGTSAHVTLSLLGIAGDIVAAIILVRDALRVRTKLHALYDAQFPPDSE